MPLLTREGVRSRAYGPAHPVDGSRPHRRARRIILRGKIDAARQGAPAHTHPHVCPSARGAPRARATHSHVFVLAMRRCCSVHRRWPHRHHHRHRRSRHRRRLATSFCSGGAAPAHAHHCVCACRVGPRQRLKAAAFLGKWVFCRWGMPRVFVGCRGATQKRVQARMYVFRARPAPRIALQRRGVNKSGSHCEYILK